MYEKLSKFLLARKSRQIDEAYTHVLTVKDDIMLLLVSRTIFKCTNGCPIFILLWKRMYLPIHYTAVNETPAYMYFPKF
jgi:hypothetical protein